MVCHHGAMALRKARRALQMVFTRKIILWRRIPVVIVVRDRLEPLEQLISWLETEGMQRIILVDNDSSYPPLVEFLRATRHRVIFLGRNAGPYCPWQQPVWSEIARGPYVVTDADIVPDQDAHGAIREFSRLLNRYPEFAKVGFGLHMDDLPDTYAAKALVMAHEAQFHEKQIRPGVFRATIDTTFALYRAGQSEHSFGPALRTGPPFQARHEPWYQNTDAPTPEFAYYRAHADRRFATWGQAANDSSDAYHSSPLRADV